MRKLENISYMRNVTETKSTFTELKIFIIVNGVFGGRGSCRFYAQVLPYFFQKYVVCFIGIKCNI